MCEYQKDILFFCCFVNIDKDGSEGSTKMTDSLMVCCLFVTIYCHATGLGPLLLAICVFIYMQMEIETKMLGVLRALGVRESVYWVSWWIPFLMISFVNAILGAITAKIIENVHVWAATSFGPIFVSLFFLNVALVGGSFLLVAVAGGTRALAALFILVNRLDSLCRRVWQECRVDQSRFRQWWME